MAKCGARCAAGSLGLVDTNGNQVTNITPSQEEISLAAWLYNRFWFDNDHQAITLGGGWMTNTGRYLVLLPDLPNGADRRRERD